MPKASYTDKQLEPRAAIRRTTVSHGIGRTSLADPPPSQLEERLATDLELLSNAPGLSVSLPAVIDTSLAQLDDAHAKSLWMLSLLTRGVTMEQAEILLKDFGDPIHIVTRLMDHSVLLKTEDDVQSPRFRVMWAVSSLVQRKTETMAG